MSDEVRAQSLLARTEDLLVRAQADTLDGHLVRALLALADAEPALMTAAARAMGANDPREQRTWDAYVDLLHLLNRVREFTEETPS